MSKKQLENIYNDICFELTNYENDEDTEMTEGDWLDIFYKLLVRVQNEIDCLQE